MYINTEVVIALMALKEVDLGSLATVTGLPYRKLEAWLVGGTAGIAKGDGPPLPEDLQMAVLQALGIKDGLPRSDMTHTWTIREPLLGSRARAWGSLETVVSAFGGFADVVYAAAEVDPFLSMTPTTTYMLRFPSFIATLNVHTSLLRPAGFSPEKVKGLRWLEGTLGVLLPTDEHASLQAGEVMPEPAHELLALTTEPARWTELQNTARGMGLTPEALVKMLAAVKDKALPNVEESSPANREYAQSPDIALPAAQEGPTATTRPLDLHSGPAPTPATRPVGLFIAGGRP